MRIISRLAVLAASSLLLGACATRGQLKIDCPQFADFVQPLPYSALEQQIRSTFPPKPGGDVAKLGALEAGRFDGAVDNALSLQRLRALPAPANDNGPPQPPSSIASRPSVLLLSGGGQWGAFGAGLLTTLAKNKSSEQPNPIAITGVSTGALQMLFIGAGLEDPAVRNAMRAAYSPRKESEVVSRQWKGFSVVTGAISGLKPLRQRIENALCDDKALKIAHKNGVAPQCPLLDRLAQTRTMMLAGFVEAESGAFQYADINAIASSPNLSPERRRSCIAGAALASVAMPAFFQQVSVNGKTYYDGGVRQSVFATEIHRRVTNRFVARYLHQAPPPLLVLRNGPTDVEPDKDANKTHNVIDSALRAEAIIVNQVEVSSVAALRLQDPYGDLGFASADGWRDRPYDHGTDPNLTCYALKTDRKKKDAQFNPAFMQCLMDFGDWRASQSPKIPVWTELVTIGAPPAPNAPPPAANDN